MPTREQDARGTPSTAVGLTFRDHAGITASPLPTGRVAQDLRVGAAEPGRVSMVTAGAPAVLVDAAGAGRTGAESLERMSADVPWLRTVRHTAAPLMGLLRPGEEPGDAVPKVGLVGPPVPYTTTLGEAIGAEDYDVSVRMLSMNAPHPAIGLTSAAAVAAAGLLEGSVVSRIRAARPTSGCASARPPASSRSAAPM
ncbi:PrpF domain-containing protein [Streptomyces sp. NPDC051243]|uniref:PrpF domain-containing protein n=1 Tax=Streptomyces sp. NPDC051243 TaxID=3365646 RepID=UPI0037B7477D